MARNKAEKAYRSKETELLSLKDRALEAQDEGSVLECYLANSQRR